MAQPISVLGIDIAKRVFHVVGMDDAGQVGLRTPLTPAAGPYLSQVFVRVPSGV